MTEHETARCPRCGSTLKTVYRRGCDTENATAHPWHTTPSPVPAAPPKTVAQVAEERGVPLARKPSINWARKEIPAEPPTYDPEGVNESIRQQLRRQAGHAETPSTERQCLIDLRNYHGKDCICPQCQFIDKALRGAEAERVLREGK